jgi:tetratricopeptide (TPR) repeat protein
VHEAHCPAHGRSVPLLPILELFRGYFGIGELDTPQAAREKVAGRLLLLDRDFESYLPLVWDFLRVPDPERPVAELDAETRQQLLSEVMRQVARARSERSPVVLLIDDLHWIDTASDAFLAQLIESLRGTRTLLLMNFRPEYRADWMQQRDYLQLPLTPLGSDAIRDLVTQLLGADESVAKLPAAIEARTAGNPFFTEEVVQTLIESGQLQGERGSFRLVRPVENLEIPESVHSVLAARIDRLPELDKHVLQTASVVGKNFPRPLLGQIANLPDAELDTALRRLCEAEFLYERSLYPIAEYAFKHPLTHEVAYGSPLAETRRGVHRALASALEQEELPNASLLAHHWDEADAPEPAVRWHKIAAEETGFSDPEATKRHWQRVSELLTRLPESAQNLIARSNVLAEILWVEMRLNPQRERAHSLYTQSIAAAEHAGDLASLARARFAYSNFLLYSGQTGSLELARRAVDEADRSGDRAVRICTRWALAINAFFTGRAEEAFQAASEGIELSQGDLFLGREIVGYSPYLFLKGVRAGANALLGRFDAAQIDLADSLSEQGAAHRTLRAVVEPFGAVIHSLSGDRRAALAHANASLEAFSATAGTAAGEVWVHYSLGLAHIDDGQPQRAIELLEHSMRVAREADSFLQAIPQALILCARAHLALANPEAAEGALEEALAIAEALSDPLALALGRLTCAELELTRAQPDLLAAEREVTAAAKLMTANQLIGHFPRTHLHRAAICRAARDEAGWRSELETAGSLYREIGATHHIEGIEARLADYAGASGV